jgi:hypothetical protein
MSLIARPREEVKIFLVRGDTRREMCGFETDALDHFQFDLFDPWSRSVASEISSDVQGINGDYENPFEEQKKRLTKV